MSRIRLAHRSRRSSIGPMYDCGCAASLGRRMCSTCSLTSICSLTWMRAGTPQPTRSRNLWGNSVWRGRTEKPATVDPEAEASRRFLGSEDRGNPGQTSRRHRGDGKPAGRPANRNRFDQEGTDPPTDLDERATPRVTGAPPSCYARYARPGWRRPIFQPEAERPTLAAPLPGVP